MDRQNDMEKGTETKTNTGHITACVDPPNLYMWIIDSFNTLKLTIHAGHIAFFMLLSAIPFTTFAVKVITYMRIIDFDELRSMVLRAEDGGIASTLINWVLDVRSSSGGVVIVVSLIGLIWSGSKGFDGLAQGLDSIYGVRDKRGYIKRRLFSMLYLIGFLIMIISTMLLLVFANVIIEYLYSIFPILENAHLLITVTRYAAIIAIFLVFFLIMYRFVPYSPRETVFERHERLQFNRGKKRKDKKKAPKKRSIISELPGAAITTILWLVFTRLYGVYMTWQIHSESVYGSFTTFFLTLMWLYFSMIFLFIGGLFNNFTYQTKEPAIRHIISDIPGLIRHYTNKLSRQ